MTISINDQSAHIFFKSVSNKGQQMIQELPNQAEYFRSLKRIHEFQINEDW